jgi:PAS domain S-box-containing protein
MMALDIQQMIVGRNLSAPTRYLLAACVFGVALGLRGLVLPLGAGLAFLTFYPGTAIVALLCGVGPSALYILMAGITGAYIFLPPHWAFDANQIVATSAFLVSATTILLVVHFYQRRVASQTQALRDEVSFRQQLAGELQQSLDRVTNLESEFRQAFDQAAVGIAHVAPDGRWLRVNPKLCNILGYTQEELLARTFQDITHPANLEDDLAQLRRVMTGEIRTYSMEKRYVRKDGGLVWIKLTVSLVRHIDGSPDYLIKVVEDITPHKEGEIARLASDQRLTGLVNSAMDAIIAVDASQRVVLFNPAAERMFGLSGSNVIGQPLNLLLPQSAHAAHTEQIQAFGRTGVTSRSMGALGAISGVRANGEVFPIEASISQVELPSGKLFTVILRDITERKQAEQALLEADQRKDEFLALLAHELRNPMAVTATAAYLLQSKGLTDPEVSRWATTTITHQTELLKRLVDDLLDVERVSRGRIALKKSRCDLVQLIARVVKEREPLNKRPKQHLGYSVPASPVWIEGDVARLTQVLTNLLDNASKFSPENGHIELSLVRDEDEAVIRVRDNGRGIPPQLLPHIFEIFTQGQVSLARDEGGLGLGLALVKALVELHGGQVTAASKGAGRGAEFTARLPVVAEIEPAKAGSTAPKGIVARKWRILIAEDNAMAAEALKQVLENSGHEVTVTRDGADALAAMKLALPEIAILDIGLPVMDGYELARQVRALPGANRLLLIALTGYGQEKDQNQAKEAGFSFHFTKPANLEQLLKIVNTCSPAKET